jgi:hypothetical protein
VDKLDCDLCEAIVAPLAPAILDVNGAALAPQIGKMVLDERVLRAMAKVPREEFVPIEVVRLPEQADSDRFR